MENCIYEKLNNEQCPINKKVSELKPLEKCELLVEWIQRNWMKQTILVIKNTLIIMFMIGIIAETFFGKTFNILSNLNTWVGFILGLVATIFSIISMFLSFYNLEKAKESEDTIKKTLKTIEDSVAKSEVNLQTLLKNEFEKIERMNGQILTSIDPSNSSNYQALLKKKKADVTTY